MSVISNKVERKRKCNHLPPEECQLGKDYLKGLVLHLCCFYFSF